ncbi:hypothetical protein ACFYNO_01390 [Kitasatospora sp. NPDC006697]|uniref:MoaF-related domain-containing protein n=1 Tax=Kitasatospora sp. NPDC006697 TaxID=3364020 RepID=UPI00368A69AA
MTLKRITTYAAAALVATATLTVANSVTASTAQASTAKAIAECCTGLVGKSLDVTLDNGLETRFDFAADGSKVTGTIEAAGQSGAVVGVVNTVAIAYAEVAKNVYVVNWNDQGGLTIALTVNLKAKTAVTYYSYPVSADASAVRGGELHKGTVRCLS